MSGPPMYENAARLLERLKRDPELGTKSYTEIGARMGATRRQVIYMVQYLLSKHRVERDLFNRLVPFGVVLPDPPPRLGKHRKIGEKPKLVEYKKPEGRQRRQRTLPAGPPKLAHLPTPATLTAEQQRALQRQQYEERQRADEEVARRIQRMHKQPLHEVSERKTICKACGNLAHRRPRLGPCSCGRYYESELIQVVSYCESSLARCAD